MDKTLTSSSTNPPGESLEPCVTETAGRSSRNPRLSHVGGRARSELNETIPTNCERRNSSNYILGRMRKSPEIELVAEATAETYSSHEDLPPRKNSLLDGEPQELAEKFLNKALKSHMQNHFTRKQKVEHEAIHKPKRSTKKPKVKDFMKENFQLCVLNVFFQRRRPNPRTLPRLC